jgi:ADP-ribose pyrophosphatase YjhB (NUDIX family)
MKKPSLLDLSRELHAMAQAGLTYAKDPYDLQRYGRLMEISSLVAREATGVEGFTWPPMVGHPTPKIDVRGLVFRGDEILLVHEATSGRWSVPGGWAEVNLTPAENVEKEIREETGYTCRATRLVSMIDRHHAGYPPHPHWIYKLFFLCKLVSGDAQPDHEILQVGFFRLDSLPPLDIARVQEADIRLGFQHKNDPTLPAYFD